MAPVTSRYIHFTISLRDLGKTDVYVQWSFRDATMKHFKYAGSTELHIINPNPDYRQVFKYEWISGRDQVWKFEVLDSKSQLQGGLELSVDDYVSQWEEGFRQKLGGNEPSSLVVTKAKSPTHLKFKLGAKSLPALDIGGRLSDPYVECFWKDGTGGKLSKFFTTKVIQNAMDCEWDEEILFEEYHKGTKQFWVFKIWDKDTFKDDAIYEKSICIDAVAEFWTRSETYVTKFPTKSADGAVTSSTLCLTIVNDYVPAPIITIASPEMSLKFRLAAKYLPRMDVLGGKSDPYVECYWKYGKSEDPIKFHETKVINNVEHCEWDEVIIFDKYREGSDQVWIFKVWDKDDFTKDDFMGQVELKVDDFYAKGNDVYKCDLFTEKGGDKATLLIIPV